MTPTASDAATPDAAAAAMEIVATVSHELRSPLTSIKGYTSLLLNRWDRLADDQKQMMLGQIQHDADRVTRLITELLDISRLEAGRLTLRRQRVELRDVAGPGRRAGDDGLPRPASRGRAARRPALGAGRPRQGRAGADEPGGERRQVRRPRPGCASSRPTTPTRSPSRSRTTAPGSRPMTCPGCSTGSSAATTAGRRGTGLGLWISRRLAEAHGGIAHRHIGGGRGLGVPLHAAARSSTAHPATTNELAARTGDPSLFADHDRRDHPAHRGRPAGCRDRVRPRRAAARRDRSLLGKKGRVTGIKRQLGELEEDERKHVGRALNEAQQTVAVGPGRAPRASWPRPLVGRAWRPSAWTSPRCGPAATPGTSTSSPR